MPAYMLKHETRCQWQLPIQCTRRATHTVYNRWNEKRGIYCERHGKRVVLQLNENLPRVKE